MKNDEKAIGVVRLLWDDAGPGMDQGLIMYEA